jgi:hypothetical protein
MPVIASAPDRGALFGHRAQIFIGGSLVHQLREWKKRKAGPSIRLDPASVVKDQQPLRSSDE